MTRSDDDKPAKPPRAGVVEARRVLHSGELAAASRVVRALAHESRNALQRGQACLSLLRLRLEGQPDLGALVDEAEEAQERLVEIYEQAREFVRSPELHMQAVALDVLVRSAWERTASGAGFRLALEVECPDALCMADPEVLGAALEAMLGNAIEAASAGSTVWVEIADADMERSPALSLTVRDEGPGVQCDLRERMFELFYTTKTGHAGLGLARARKGVESLGGQLTALEGSGRGAQLRMVLPRDP